MTTTMLDDAKVFTRPGHSSTEYSITGALEAVLNVIKSLFEQYPPEGYGTHVHAIAQGNDGVYVARVSRATSCD